MIVRASHLAFLALSLGGCTALLGGFDFDGPAVGGAGGSAGSTASGGGGNTCSPCAEDIDCKLAQAEVCATNKCDTVAGCCTTVPVPEGAHAPDGLQTTGDCQLLVCDGTKGGTKSVDDPADAPAPLGQCYTGQCNGTAPSAPVQLPKTGSCTEMGGTVCGDPGNASIAGKCVTCNVDTDCEDPNLPVCGASNTCVTPLCANDKQDGTETDVDCGGGTCPKCAFGQACSIDSDCVGGVCSGNVCAASCGDGVENGDETDIDCGGGTCPGCIGGQGCESTSDCATLTHGTMSCTLNACKFTCDSDWWSCTAAEPCAVDIKNDPANCGSCNHACGAFCESGSCNDPIAVGAGASHTCAVLGDGTVWCWGDNSNGQLGSATTSTFTPTMVAGLTGTATAVAGGRSISCALAADQSVWCWGDNGFGGLGVGDTTPHTGAQHVTSLAGVTKVAVGDDHACAVAGGNLYCWGANYYGQIGNGGANAPAPVQVLSSVSSVTAGSGHTCALKTNGTVVCWGRGVVGQLGDGLTGDTNAPGAPIAGLSGVLEIASAASASHTCARTSAGIHCWGRNQAGQIGNGTKGTDQLSPTTTPIALSGITELAVGSVFSGAVTSSGLYMWGQGGMLGDGTMNEQLSPHAINLPNVVVLTGGESHACALTSGGVISCWGANSQGQLGNSNAGFSSPSPVPVIWP